MSDSGKRAPGNTSAIPPQILLIEGLAAQEETGNANNMIPMQEARGQQSFVNSDTLPTRANDHGGPSSKAVLEAAGVKFGDVVKGDPLFQYVELPAGWKKVMTGHSMWSNLLDDRGRTRATIFYKAAFYDRGAFYSASLRYSVQVDYERQDREGVTVALVKDGDSVIHTTDPVPTDEERTWEASDKATASATAWLNEQFPDWRNPGAYWD